MVRFAFTFTLLLSVVGCQSAASGPKSGVIVHSPQSIVPAKTFWSRATTLFQPLMPDRHNRSADTHFALNRSDSDFLPIHHTSNSLYQAGSIFPSPYLTTLKEEPILVAETVTNPEPPRPLVEVPETSDNLPKDTAAPFPDSELVVEKRGALRKRILEDEEEDFELDEEPIQIARKSLTKRDTPAAQAVASPPAPVYPHLAQWSGAASPTAAPTVTQASYQQSMPPYNVPGYGGSGYGAGDWQTPARQTIEQLRYAIEQTPHGRTVSNEMRLRMLEMLLGNKAEAAKPMPSADKTVNAFMGNHVLGFAALLDDSMPDGKIKYVSAAYRFNEGLQELQNLCPFKLKNVNFVDDWFDFGQFIPRTKDFHPGEKFLVYMELDNPTSRRIIDGFEVSMSVSYEIRDAQAKVVDKKEIGPSVLRTLSRKRDYTLAFPGTLPTSLAPGQYQLRINVTDLNDDSMSYSEEQIPFKVVPSLAGE